MLIEAPQCDHVVLIVMFSSQSTVGDCLSILICVHAVDRLSRFGTTKEAESEMM